MPEDVVAGSGQSLRDRLAQTRSCPGRGRYPRSHRLRCRSEFTACYEGGRRYHTEHFILFALPGAGEKHGRTGMAVSRKVGNAVMRNRIKRLLREFFRLHAASLPQGTDIVAVAKRQAGGCRLDYARLEAELMPVMGRLARRFAVTGGGEHPAQNV